MKLKELFFILCVSRLVQSGPFVLVDNCECGKAVEPSARIFGGNETKRGEFPWTVGLYQAQQDKSPFCGGAIISTMHIVTAAHCLTDTYANWVSLGDHDTWTTLEAKSLKVGVEDYNNNDVIHPDYKGGNGKLFPVHDIAILQLKNPLNFQPWNKNIRPICLPSPDLNTDTDSYGKPVVATVAGWGNMGYNGLQSKVLRSVDLEVLKNSDCNPKFAASLGGIQPFHMCAYAKGKDACQGDSGGALFAARPFSDMEDRVRRKQLIGIVSFGDKCGTIGKPGGYTRVSKYMEWLIEKMSASRRSVGICSGTFGKWSKNNNSRK